MSYAFGSAMLVHSKEKKTIFCLASAGKNGPVTTYSLAFWVGFVSILTISVWQVPGRAACHERPRRSTMARAGTGFRLRCAAVSKKVCHTFVLPHFQVSVAADRGFLGRHVEVAMSGSYPGCHWHDQCFLSLNVAQFAFWSFPCGHLKQARGTDLDSHYDAWGAQGPWRAPQALHPYAYGFGRRGTNGHLFTLGEGQNFVAWNWC